MPPPLDHAKRQKIEADLKAGKSARATARHHGVGAATVSRIAARSGIGLERAKTKMANEAKAVDHRTRLISLATRDANLAEAILDSFEAMTLEDWQQVSPHSRGILLGIAQDKARDLGPEDTSADEARSAMTAIEESIRSGWKP